MYKLLFLPVLVDLVPINSPTSLFDKAVIMPQIGSGEIGMVSEHFVTNPSVLPFPVMLECPGTQSLFILLCRARFFGIALFSLTTRVLREKLLPIKCL